MYSSFECASIQAFGSPLIELLSPDLYLRLKTIFFIMLILRDFLEEHLQFFIRYLTGISKYSDNAIPKYQTILCHR